MIKLSIIIPIYNSEKYLVECIKSITDIKSDLIEIILINDGSSDNSEKICLDYCEKDKRVKYYFKNNTGVSDTRNYGILKSNGKWIMFVDSDDKLNSNWFDIVSKWFENDTDLIIFTNDDIKCKSKNICLDYVFNIKNGTFFSSPCSKLYKNQIIKDKHINFEKGIINGEDMLFNVMYIINSNDFLIDNNCIYLYRQVVGSSTKKFDKIIFESNSKFINCLDNIERKYSFSLQKYIKYSKVNAIYTFINRLAYASKIEIKNNKHLLVNYCKTIKYEDIKIVNNHKKKIIVLLTKMNLISLTIVIIKLKNKLKKQKNDYNTFINI